MKYLSDKKNELEKQFNELELQKTNLSNQISQITIEQLRLQGAFKLIEEMEKIDLSDIVESDTTQ